jgi:hypothetical protein
MTKRKPNPQRGGRKRTGNERHTVSLPPEQWAYIDVQPGKNRSERLSYVVQRAKVVKVAPTGDTVIIDAPPLGKRIVVYGIVEVGGSDNESGINWDEHAAWEGESPKLKTR